MLKVLLNTPSQLISEQTCVQLIVLWEKAPSFLFLLLLQKQVENFKRLIGSNAK